MIQNSCKSFHDTMIQEVNAERTGEASATTTYVAVKILDYLKIHTFHGQKICAIIGFQKTFPE
jgi:hypothetical protein